MDARTLMQRRRLIAITGASLAAGAAPLRLLAADPSPQRAAAVQFTPALGDVAANLQKAERLARQALQQGARWVVLPEFFPTGLAMHRSMLDAHRPLDGEPRKLLLSLATEGKACVAGSWLVRSGGDVFNTMTIACPDGSIFTHDKDFPTTAFESSFFAGGEDAEFVEQLKRDGARPSGGPLAPRGGNSTDGAFSHGDTGIGGALCWEIVRHRTARRLRGRVDVLLASSAWWTADPDAGWPGMAPDAARARWADHQRLIDAAPARMARMIGAPVVHANFCGPNPGYAGSSFEREARGRFLGSSCIVDAQGRVLARLGTDEGIAIADVGVARAAPADAVPDDFWLPEVTEHMRRGWAQTGAAGRDFYLRESRKHYAAAR